MGLHDRIKGSGTNGNSTAAATLERAAPAPAARRGEEAPRRADARPPEGSPDNAITPPLALRGPTLSIRKFSRDPYTIDDLISFGTLSSKAAHFLAACVRG